jgi:hypothetical protein
MRSQNGLSLGIAAAVPIGRPDIRLIFIVTAALRLSPEP